MANPPKLSKAFPVIMEICTEKGQDRMIKTLHNYFPDGYINVVCPDCGTANKIAIKGIEEHIKLKGHHNMEFDDCKKCGRSLVFDDPMWDDKYGNTEENQKETSKKIAALKKRANKTADGKEKKWNPVEGKWEEIEWEIPNPR